MGKVEVGGATAAVIKVREVASTAKLGEGNRVVEEQHGEIPVSLPAVCCACGGAPERTATFHREEGIAAGVGLFLTGATAAGAKVRQRFLDLEVPICGACETRYRRRQVWASAFAIIPLLGFLVAMLVTQRGVFALACVGWMAGPFVAFGLAHKLGAFVPGRMGTRARPRFRNRAYQEAYDRLNAKVAPVPEADTAVAP